MELRGIHNSIKEAVLFSEEMAHALMQIRRQVSQSQMVQIIEICKRMTDKKEAKNFPLILPRIAYAEGKMRLGRTEFYKMVELYVNCEDKSNEEQALAFKEDFNNALMYLQELLNKDMRGG